MVNLFSSPVVLKWKWNWKGLWNISTARTYKMRMSQNDLLLKVTYYDLLLKVAHFSFTSYNIFKVIKNKFCIYIYAIFKECKWQIMLAVIVSYNLCSVRMMTLSIVDITWKLFPQYVWSVVSESVTVIFTDQFFFTNK